jgi:hypothetical protein
LALILVLGGAAYPHLAAAQDSTDIGVPLPPAKPYSIKWWGVGAVVGAGLLTMAVVDEPVQQWATNPANHSSTTNEIASTTRRFGEVEVVVPVTAGIIIAGLATSNQALFHSGLRIGASVAVARLVTSVFKYALGVERPSDGRTSRFRSRQWQHVHVIGAHGNGLFLRNGRRAGSASILGHGRSVYPGHRDRPVTRVRQSALGE